MRFAAMLEATFRPQGANLICRLDFRFWHKADMAIALSDVRFSGVKRTLLGVKLSSDEKARSRKASSVASLSFYDHFKAAVDHALPVKRHGIYVRF